ncbi:Tetratricopeptide-like helical [Phaffia rhodozyma]|uniref:Tetratricopeptide-like helical n=1 Tax=Phaffia rhodozyma TaxID=264483 RepID=A0A0F7SJ03_PHARH|nr:Tetratricopeptide-like helical [Phaffia rhodozyma]
MAKACSQCGSTKWRRGPGGIRVCEEGHINMSYRQETMETAEGGGMPVARHRRTKKNRLRKDRTKHAVYWGDQAEYLYYECLQILVRTQVKALTRIWDLPPEFEMIVRDLFSLCLLFYKLPPPPGQTEDDFEAPPSSTQPLSQIPSKPPSAKRSPVSPDSDTEPSSSSSTSSNSSDSSSSESELDEESREQREETIRELERIHAPSESSDASSEDESHIASEARTKTKKGESGKESETKGRRRRKKAGEGPTYSTELGQSDRLSMLDCLSIVVLGCWSLNVPVLFHEFINLTNSHEIPYLAFVYSTHIPSSIRPHLNRYLYKMLTPPWAPTSSGLYKNTTKLALQLQRKFEIRFPPMNAPPIIWKCLRSLGCSPVVYPTVVNLLRQLRISLALHPLLITPAEAFLHAQSDMSEEPLERQRRMLGDEAMPEIAVMSCCLIVLKMAYGLDGIERLVVNANDPGVILLPKSEWLTQLRTQHEQRKNRFDKATLASTKFDPLELVEEDLDRYLDLCQNMLQDGMSRPKAYDTMSAYTSLSTFLPPPPTPSDPPPLEAVWPSHHRVSGPAQPIDALPVTKPQSPLHPLAVHRFETCLIPGEVYSIYASRDVLGQVPDELELVVREAGITLGVEEEDLMTTLGRLESRLVRFIKEGKLQEKDKEEHEDVERTEEQVGEVAVEEAMFGTSFEGAILISSAMASLKKRKAVDPSDPLVSIKGLITSIKPLLQATRPSIPVSSDLQHLLTTLTFQASNLAAAIAQSRSAPIPAADQDLLDTDGVAMWNRSSQLLLDLDHQTDPKSDTNELYGMVRLAAFQLIVLTYEPELDAGGLTRLLMLGSKAASALLLTTLHNQEVDRVLTQCATFEEQLSKAPASNVDSEKKERARATTMYYLSRAESMFRQDKLEPAFFMIGKAADEQRLSLLSEKETHAVLHLIQRIGHTLTTSSKEHNDGDLEISKNAMTAVEWLSLGLRLTEGNHWSLLKGRTEKVETVKRDILFNLAQAYIISSSLRPENMERAEASLDELLADDTALKCPRSQQFKWLKLHCVKQRPASDPQLLEAFRAVINAGNLFGSTVDSLIRDTMHSKLGISRNVSYSVLRHTLSVLLLTYAQADEDDRPDLSASIIKVLLSIALFARGEPDIDKSIREIRSSFDMIDEQTSFELDSTPCAALQTLVWQIGNARYAAVGGLHDAIAFYLLLTHPALKVLGESVPKLHKKIAMCYIRLEDYERAMEHIRKSPWEEAATHYLRFLLYLNQSECMEDEAVGAIKDMSRCQDNSGKMIMLTTQLASDASLSRLLEISLSTLLDAIQTGTFPEAEKSTVFVLIRCLVRLSLKQLENLPTEVGDDANRLGLENTLLRHFEAGLEKSIEAVASQEASQAEKEISWLYKQAYNAAVTGCQQGWSESCVYKMFELSSSMMDIFQKVSFVTDPDLPFNNCLASFAACSGRMLEAREQDGEAKKSSLQILGRNIETCLKTCRQVVDPQSDSPRSDKIKEMIMVLIAFQVEASCALQEWKKAETIVEEFMAKKEASVQLFESLANIIWRQDGCPTDVVYTILRRILFSSLDLDLIPSLDKLSRWLRTLISILNARGRASDIEESLSLLNQGIDLLKANAGSLSQSYPEDEVEWLLAVAWNKGNEDYV